MTSKASPCHSSLSLVCSNHPSASISSSLALQSPVRAGVRGMELGGAVTAGRARRLSPKQSKGRRSRCRLRTVACGQDAQPPNLGDPVRPDCWRSPLSLQSACPSRAGRAAPSLLPSRRLAVQWPCHTAPHRVRSSSSFQSPPRIVQLHCASRPVRGRPRRRVESAGRTHTLGHALSALRSADSQSADRKEKERSTSRGFDTNERRSAPPADTVVAHASPSACSLLAGVMRWRVR